MSEQAATTTTTTTKQEKVELEENDSYEVAGQAGHTFVVSKPILTAVPVMKPKQLPTTATTTTDKSVVEVELEEEEEQQPCCSQAVLPLSSSLPSRLLRLHARRSAQALLQQMQGQSADSQFSSDEGDTAPSAPPLSPDHSSGDEKLHDVGMGSSIGDSEESEEDDELKPLAVDNHIMHDVDLGEEQQQQQQQSESLPLSEANLEKFHKHQPTMDNIYLHPNFKHDNYLDSSPPPAVAPANSPVPPPRTHRSFLTLKKSQENNRTAEQQERELEMEPQSPQSQPINEIDTLDVTLAASDDLAAEIAEAVEFYFSDDSILKDAFLLKHVRRNKDGFVSLKLVSSFKRVRQLTKEWRVVGDAVRRKSHKIELNDVGTKVRRLEPLPSFDETMPSRTIVACDLPLDKLSIEKVSELFSSCGEIALIRILKPGMAIPVDVRQFMNKHPELQQKECALVEYLESYSARDAKNLQGPFQVFEMVAPKKKTGKKAAVIQLAAPVARMVESYRYYNDASNYERSRGGSFSHTYDRDNTTTTSGDLRFKLRRNNSDYHPKNSPMGVDISPTHYYHQHHQHQHQHHHQNQPHHYQSQHQPHSPSSHRGSFTEQQPIYHNHHHHHQQQQPRGSISSLGGGGHEVASSPNSNSMNFFAYSPRRYSNASTISASCPTSVPLADTQSPPVKGVVTSSAVSSLQRRLSNCSEQNYSGELSPRRTSNCSETGVYRKSSVCSTGSNGGGGGGSGVGGERRFSNGSMQFERTFSNASEGNGFYRRPSLEPQQTYCEPITTTDQLVGGGGGGYHVWPSRRYSNNFQQQQLSSKLAAYDNAQYINGRRISTDSGYDRRCSFGSEFEGSPRSRTGSFLSGGYDGQPRSRTGSFLDGSPRSRSGSFAQRAAESLVRTPIGPDGSKGFGSRSRKFGQTVSPVN